MSEGGFGQEAYRDDPDYTAPEMEPGHGEDRPPRETEPGGPPGAAIVAIGLPGQGFIGDVFDHRADEVPRAPEDEE